MGTSEVSEAQLTSRWNRKRLHISLTLIMRDTLERIFSALTGIVLLTKISFDGSESLHVFAFSVGN